MDLITVSQLIIGRAIKQQLSIHAFDTELFLPEFRSLVRDMKQGKTIEELFMASYSSIMMQAERVAESSAVLGEIDYDALLRDANKQFRVEQIAQRIQKQAREKTLKVTDAQELVHLLRDDAKRLGSVLMSDVDMSPSPVRPTGFAPVDEHLGGLPEASITVLGATPGAGKTWLVLQIIVEYLRLWTEEEALLINLEMTNSQLVRRALQTMNLSKSITDRIHMLDDSQDSSSFEAALSQEMEMYPKISIVALDYVDLMVPNVDAQSMELAYKMLQRVTKNYKLILLLVAQLSGKYEQGGGIPMANDLRWTRMAEAVSALVLTIYNPYSTMVRTTGGIGDWIYPEMGYAHLIAAKTKFETPHTKPGDSNTGAIRVPFKSQTYEGVWGNAKETLWTPYQGRG